MENKFNTFSLRRAVWDMVPGAVLALPDNEVDEGTLRGYAAAFNRKGRSYSVNVDRAAGTINVTRNS